LLKRYNGMFEPINLYWMDWNGRLEWYNIVLLILYLAVIAMGLGSAWRRWRWVGLLPLVLSVGYAFATAVGRFSGWRYDLPADWIWYFYFGIGFAELLRHVALVFGAENAIASSERQSGALTAHGLHARNGLAPALLFILISASPWLIKTIAVPRYPDQSLTALESKIALIANAPSSNEIHAFTSQPEAFLQAGRLLYPRFFSRNNGLASTNPWPAYAVRDFPRLGFLLLNQNSKSVIFPGRINSMSFPHGSDAIILGCQREDYVEVRLIAFPELDSVYLSAPLTKTCAR
jgi:hypothetical protein